MTEAIWSMAKHLSCHKTIPSSGEILVYHSKPGVQDVFSTCKIANVRNKNDNLYFCDKNSHISGTGGRIDARISRADVELNIRAFGHTYSFRDMGILRQSRNLLINTPK
jgi:hypothetical protein